MGKNISDLQNAYETMLFKSSTLTYVQKNDSRQKWEKTGLSLDQMLIACGLKSRICTYSEFVYSFNGLYGNCYTFNSGKSVDGTVMKVEPVSQGGAYNGFWFELLVGSPSNINSLSTGSGATIYVTNQSTFNSIYSGIFGFIRV